MRRETNGGGEKTREEWEEKHRDLFPVYFEYISAICNVHIKHDTIQMETMIRETGIFSIAKIT